MSYRYSYLLLGLLFLIIWIVLYVWRKNVRQEMIVLSLIFGIVGLFVEIAYLVDWWTPYTITYTRIGIEDFLFGSAVGGGSSSPI